MSRKTRTKPLPDLQFIIQRKLVCNLILFQNEIKAFWQYRVVLVLVFADLEQHFDHVLHTFIDDTLVQNGAESREDVVVRDGRVFGQEGADFADEANGDFDSVVCWRLEKEHKNLKCDYFVRYALVDEVCDERCRRVANNLKSPVSHQDVASRKNVRANLVVALEGSAELADKPDEYQLANLRQFCVDDRNKRRKDRCERQRRGLRLHDRTSKQPHSPDQILRKQLRNDIFDIRHVDAIDDTRDRFAQRIP